jgi:predicted Rossmann-fold nucleotide-binding protein
MFELSDAFVSFPGGIGTLEETVEILTWRQLGLHAKPILICDIEGAVVPLIGAIEGAIARGFAAPSLRDVYELVVGVPALLSRLESLRPVGKGGSDRL